VATPAKAALSVADVLTVAGALAEQGVREIKLTGGDPALWPPLVECVSQLSSISGVRVDVISRHPKIGELAAPLAEAGVALINVSIDTLNPELHRLITARDDLPLLLRSVRAIVAAGIPCKINTVVMRGVNDHEVLELVDYCEREGVHTLKLLDIIEDLDSGSEAFVKRLRVLRVEPKPKNIRDLYLPLAGISSELGKRAVASKEAFQGGLGHPMTQYTMASGLNVLIKDHHAGAWFGSVCNGCPHFPCHDALMALRLTADLRLQFCLLREDVLIDLRPAMRAGPVTVRKRLDEAMRVYGAAWFKPANEAVISTAVIGT